MLDSILPVHMAHTKKNSLQFNMAQEGVSLQRPVFACIKNRRFGFQMINLLRYVNKLQETLQLSQHTKTR